VQLRGLGVGTTLTLVNGQRQGASGYQGTFTDVSSIPVSAIERIERSPIDKLIVTNTIPLTAAAASCSKIVVLSVARLLGQAIKSIHEETSVSSLFV
jgi:phosphoribosylpyrophosphate synthetase